VSVNIPRNSTNTRLYLLAGILVLIVCGSLGSSVGYAMGQPIRNRILRNPARSELDGSAGAAFSSLAVLAVVWFLGLTFDRGPSPDEVTRRWFFRDCAVGLGALAYSAGRFTHTAAGQQVLGAFGLLGCRGFARVDLMLEEATGERPTHYRPPLGIFSFPGLRLVRERIEGSAKLDEQLAQAGKGVSLETLFSELGAGAVQDLNLVVKGDVVGSVEAALSELQKIQHPEVRITVIHSGVGGITENDVMLASASQALVVGFNVRPNAEARGLAEREGVDIRTYRVIYRLTEDIEQALIGMLRPVQTEETIGEAEVRQLFRVSRLGTIAGSYVTQGVVRRNAQVRVLREGTVVADTSISQLKRFKDDVREVEEGFECGILLENFNDVKEGDVLELYETRQIERTDLT